MPMNPVLSEQPEAWVLTWVAGSLVEVPGLEGGQPGGPGGAQCFEGWYRLDRERMVVAENKGSGSCRRRDRNDGVPGVG